MSDWPTDGGRPASPYLEIGATVGHYRIESFVAHGGMAFVYEATDLRLGRHVALKLLAAPPTHESDFRERFMRESRYAASLDHPNIVPIYEAGEADGLLFIAMRFVSGVNLDARLREVHRLDGPAALAVLTPIADALDLAHAAGLVHRDVKPANILLTDAGRGHEHVYLTDFGITKHTSGLTKLTATGNVIGTMTYTAPEQIRGDRIDARTDLYALGCVAYQCLTGVAPFVRDNQWALVYAHLNERPAPVSSHRPELAAADPVIARALEKDPAQRFARCEDFTDALSVALAGRAHRAPTGPVGPADPLTNDPADAAPPAPAARPTAGPPAPDSATPASAARPASALPSPGSAFAAPAAPGPAATDPAAPGPAATDPAASGPVAADPAPTGSASSGVREPRPPIRLRTGAHRSGAGHRRRSTVLASLAALAVIAMLVVILGPWPGPRLESGSGRPAVVPSPGDTPATTATDGSGSGQPTGSSDHHGSAGGTAAASGSVVLSTDAATVNPPPQTAPASVVPAAAVAIPNVEGQPIEVGQTPGSVSITPNGRFAYVANRAAGTVTVVDTNVDKVSAVIPVADGPPWYVAFTPDGTRAYVSVYNADKTINRVAVLDARTTREIRSVDVDTAPYALAVTPDQRSVFVPSHDTARIDVIDTGTDAVVRQIDVPRNPHAIKFTPDGRFAYVANHESNLVSVVAVAAGTVVNTIGVGTSPHSLALSPDGSQLAVACYDSNDVYFVDVASGAVIGTAPVGTHPQDIEYSADGAYVYSADVDGNTVSVVDTATRGIKASIPTTSPTSIAVTPDGRRAYVTNLDAGTLTVLNTGG